jgi:defect-in-organelle-trafficking protein DotD
MKKILLPLLICIAAATFLGGCAKQNQAKDPALTALEQSAKQIEKDLRQLVLLSTDQPQGGLRAVLPKKGALGKKIVMKWNGPIEPAVKGIAKQIRYKYKIMGIAPAAPVMVSVDVVKQAAYNVLDAIAWQAANKAQLLVDPLKKQITLAYLPAFGTSAEKQTPDAPKAVN